MLLFVHFFPSHIGHHLPFIRNSRLTVKSHIPTHKRGEKASCLDLLGRESSDMAFGMGDGEQIKVCYLRFWGFRITKRVNTFLPPWVCLYHHPLDFDHSGLVPSFSLSFIHSSNNSTHLFIH